MDKSEFLPNGFEEQEFDQANELVQKRQRYRRKAKSASYVLNQLLARKGYLQHGSNRELEQAWNSIVDRRWLDKTRVGNIRRGVLEVFVESTSVSQHLNFQKQTLLRQLREQLAHNNINDIRFRVQTF